MGLTLSRRGALAMPRRFSGDIDIMLAEVAQLVAAVNLLHENMLAGGKESRLTLPFAIMSAFLLEVLLKTLRAIDGSTFLGTHKLDVLFDDLPPDYQELVLSRHRMLTEQHYQGAKDPDVLFVELLGESAGLFEDSRYFFSQEDAGRGERYYFNNLAPLAEAVYQAIQLLEPRARQPRGRITTTNEEIH